MPKRNTKPEKYDNESTVSTSLSSSSDVDEQFVGDDHLVADVEHEVISSDSSAAEADASASAVEEVEAEEEEEKKEDAKLEDGPKVSCTGLFAYATAFDWLLMFLGSFGAMAQGLAMPSFSIVFGELLDAFNQNRLDAIKAQLAGLPPPKEKSVFDLTKEWSYILIYVGLGAFASAMMQHACWRLAAYRQCRRMRYLYVQQLMRMDPSWFDSHSASSLVTRLNSDLNTMQKGMGEDIALAIQFFTTFVFGFALGFWQGWELTLLLMGIAPILAACGALIMKVIASSQSAEQTAYGEAGAVVSEVLAALRTVVGLGAEQQMIKRFTDKLELATKAEEKKGWYQGLGMGVTWSLFFFAYGASFRFGFWLIHNNDDWTGGKIMMVMFGVLIGAFALGQGMSGLVGAAKARAVAYHINEVIATEPTIDPLSSKGKKLKKVKGQISFKGVKFHYPNREEVKVLRGIDIEMPAGSTIALVGESGCGKSTTLGLIQRMYDVAGGSVTLDGVDVRKLNVTWLRQQIGIVAQEPVLFAGTIADNIAFGAIQQVPTDGTSLKELLQSVPAKEIKAAARAAFAHDFIKAFPEAYDTYIGESGAQLSGGQKQRIAIARAILKNPKVLLLDEATSALDSRSEKIVQKALDQASHGRTTIIVAHRLSTIRHADKIFVFEKGKVIESGSHDELLVVPNSKYSTLWSAQNAAGVAHIAESVNLATSAVDVPEEEVPDDVADEAKVADEEEEKIPAVPLARLWKMSQPELLWIVLGAVGALMNGAVMPSFALLFGEFIDLFFLPEKEAEEEVNYWTIGFFVVGIACILGNALQFGAFGVSGAKLTARLRVAIFKRVLSNELAWFDDKANEPNIIGEKLASRTSKVQSAFGPRLGNALMNLVTVVYGLTLAFVNGWLLTLVVLGALPIVSIGQVFQMRLNAGMASGSGAALEVATVAIAEAVQKIKTTAAFTREQLLTYEYQRSLEEANPKQVRFTFFAGFAAGWAQGGMIIIYGPVMLFGAYLVDEGEMNFQDVMIVFFAIVMMGMSLGQGMGFAPDMADVSRASKEVFEILDRPEPVDTHDTIDGFDDFKWSGSSLKALKKNGPSTIAFNDVSFAYPTRPDATVLSGFSASIQPGKVVAFVGSSGAGKSTVVQLLQRFYDPLDGKLQVSGDSTKKAVDLRDIPVRWFRKQLGVVGQEPVLFSGSIKDNMRIGNPTLSDEAIIEACKGSQAHAFIDKFPKKYDTEVGAKGAQLSGGQKQRIAIARALARDPKILLLDEATSALDSQSERLVQKTLDKVMKGRTTVVVAHRLSTVRNADEIVVMEKGSVAERGTHDELMAKKSAYYQLVQRQHHH